VSQLFSFVTIIVIDVVIEVIQSLMIAGVKLLTSRPNETIEIEKSRNLCNEKVKVDISYMFRVSQYTIFDRQ
jgi:hypothetical protein